MSKPKQRMKGHTHACGQKRKFATLEEAEAASRRGRWDFMQAYACPKCKQFHYGHP